MSINDNHSDDTTTVTEDDCDNNSTQAPRKFRKIAVPSSSTKDDATTTGCCGEEASAAATAEEVASFLYHRYQHAPCCTSPKDSVLNSLQTAKLEVADIAPSTVQLAIQKHAEELIFQNKMDESFYIVDLGTVERLYTAFVEAMPRVKPYYAVKCNPDPGLISMLSMLGCGFDCASQAEIDQVMSLGVSVSNIIYAQPCKPPRQLAFATAAGIELTTFDTESELYKIASLHPTCGVLLRIRADDTSARCQLGNKFGADPITIAPDLLALAQKLGLTVRGICFHVGSGATDPAAFYNAVHLARTLFDYGAYSLSISTMNILDIGGGFAGGSFDEAGTVDLGKVPDAINAALDTFFPEIEGEKKIQVMAEPGRYFAEASSTYACIVNGYRQCTTPIEANAASAERGGNSRASDITTTTTTTMEYWLSDGLYGAMNCLVYDHAVLAPIPLRSPLLPAITETIDDGSYNNNNNNTDGPSSSYSTRTTYTSSSSSSSSAPVYKSVLFGPTCDGMDTVCRDAMLPRLRNGDWVIFPKFGAYTSAGACDFNGFPITKVPKFYVYAAGITMKE
jgi:ornithine decarboxylase